ncbi:PREDICTED: ral guanine nucleotide dissociation stimulator isoform X2 [Papilio xuthus]|uniref:Ral guanine nucleotide dissociation stimulator isoform X2 n=1 Tax=Papilio xuthus TaxID=66420 RepID=A0AAJ6ZA65_PAPXU|nr:PREDICTED: ral guanine nucleotide dissociation stimulator isoform X2 [Papilio xuthus]
MLVRGCAGGELRHSLAERTKALAARYHALCSPAREESRSVDRARTRHRKSQTRWYVKPTWRLWGEERVDGAIYTVYLKKVRYHRPTRSASSESDDEISHLEWETVRVRFVKAGTVERLVEALATDDGELESTYVNVFLATYRSFAECSRVLDLLVRRYEALAAEDTLPAHAPAPPGADHSHQHRKTLVACLHVWLDTYPEDFRQPPHHPALQQLLAFTQLHLPGSELHLKVLQKLAVFSAERNGGAHVGGGVCLAPGMRLSAHHTSTYRLPHVPHRHFAEQLTRMDMELFKKLVPHQCLGAIWSRRDKDRSHDAATVLATVNQFNAVSFRVISTILVEPNLRPADRAEILAAWFDIARELRVLKNFSSLKAIISGLQSNAVYRLRKTWALLPKEKSELFEELARIFSEDNNRWAQRELLMREGTAKFADTVGENDRQLQKLLHERGSPGVSHGTIPYLGTFLTDLTMIDTAIPDTVADGLINFDKRRKEFEVLAQIKLLQGAANAYHLPSDAMFDRWFDSVIILDDREAYQLSCQIEPPTNPPKERRPRKIVDNNNQCHRKNDSIASTSSSNSSQFYCETDGAANAWKRDSLERRTSPTRLSHGSSSSSLPSLDVSLSSANSGQKPPNGKAPATSPAYANTRNGPDFYIIRVTYESDCVETEGVVLYKSIMLSNNERTPQVIRNAMLKLNLDGDPDAYTLAQVLPDREMVLPANANVYYAVNTAYNLNFILRPRKSQQAEPVANGKPKNKRN